MREYLGPAVARVVGDTVTNNTINPSSTTLTSPSIPKRRRKKDQGETKTNKKTPFFQETVPTLRATADSTAKRPPRSCFGYVCVSGSSREYSPKSSNVSSDRLFFIENYCGSNEQTLFGCVEGHGIQGAAVSSFLTRIIPDVISAIARDTVSGGKARKHKKILDEDIVFDSNTTITAADSLPFPLLTLQPRDVDKVVVGGDILLSSLKRSPTDLLLATAKAIVSNTSTGKAIAEAIAIEKREQKRLAKIAAETGTRLYTSSSSSTVVGGGAGGLSGSSLNRVQVRISEILKDSFKEANAQLVQLSSPDNPDGGLGAGEAGSTIKIDTTASGASMITCLVRGRTLYVSSIGCCRAVLGKLAPSHALEAAAEDAETNAAKHLIKTTTYQKAEKEGGGEDEGNDENDRNKIATHVTPAQALTAASFGSKFSSVTAANRLARLNLGISALDTSRVFNTEGSTKRLTSASQRALIASSHALENNTTGDQKSLSLLSQSFGGLSSSELAKAEDKLLYNTNSIPHFPDLPHVIESVLQNAQQTYGKPSRILAEKRRELLVAMKTSMNHATFTGTLTSKSGTLLSTLKQKQQSILPQFHRPIISGSKDPAILARESEEQDLYEVECKIRQASFSRYGKLGIPPTNTSNKPKQVPTTSLTSNMSSVFESSVDFTEIPKSWEKEGLGKAVARRFAEARALEEATSGLLNHTISLPSRSFNSNTTESRQDFQPSSTLVPITASSTTSALLMSDARYYNEKGEPVQVPIAIALSRDHRPDRPDECLRIYKKGGRVEVGMLQNGEPTRVARIFGQNSDGPGLHTSRCLGFTSGRSLGISTEADVIVRPIEPEDRFVIVASDGLWSVVSSDEAVQSVSRSCSSILWGGSAAAGYEGDEGRCYFQGNNKEEEEEEDVTKESGFSSSSPFEFARKAIITRPSLSSKRDLPYIEHPSPQVHLSPSPSTELRISVCAGAAPSAGFGGWGGYGASRQADSEDYTSTSDMPLDLLESVTPALYRSRIRDRIRRVALSAAEALVALARSRWKKATTGSNTSTNGPGLHDDISVLVVVFDQLPPPPKV